MISTPAIAALALTAAVSYGLYEVKYEVQRLERRHHELSRELVKEREATHVLKAEWSYLSRPQRVQKLARRFLAIRPTTAGQVAHFHDLPVRRVTDEMAEGGPKLMVPSPRLKPHSRPMVQHPTASAHPAAAHGVIGIRAP